MVKDVMDIKNNPAGIRGYNTTSGSNETIGMRGTLYM